jgi:hypothetical protein
MANRRPTIAILTHVTDDFRQARHLIHQIIPRWETMGFNVVVTTDVEPFVPAEVALLHVDLSVVPETCRRLAERYPRVLNGRVFDIRKRRFSQLVVNRNGPDPGSVMVKSDWNHGGRWDFRQRILESSPARLLRPLHLDNALYRALAWLETKRSWPRRSWLSPDGYRVYSQRDQVPAEVWKNPNLVVERFISEREGPYYCCRHWLFFGDREVGRRTMSLNPVVKAQSKLEPLSDPVPDELRAIRHQTGFDYGKFDYGIVNGQVILYDMNRTPGISSHPQRHTETVEVLSPGIHAFFG